VIKTKYNETERPLHKRLQEHQTRTQSAVYEHIESNNHALNLESTSVLNTELHPFRRKVKEALHIKARRPSLTRDSGIELPSVYDLILNWIHNTWLNCEVSSTAASANKQASSSVCWWRPSDLVEIYSLRVSFSSVERKRVLMINAGGGEFTF
jgi:hypothetical protein